MHAWWCRVLLLRRLVCMHMCFGQTWITSWQSVLGPHLSSRSILVKCGIHGEIILGKLFRRLLSAVLCTALYVQRSDTLQMPLEMHRLISPWTQFPRRYVYDGWRRPAPKYECRTTAIPPFHHAIRLMFFFCMEKRCQIFYLFCTFSLLSRFFLFRACHLCAVQHQVMPCTWNTYCNFHLMAYMLHTHIHKHTQTRSLYIHTYKRIYSYMHTYQAVSEVVSAQEEDLAPREGFIHRDSLLGTKWRSSRNHPRTESECLICRIGPRRYVSTYVHVILVYAFLKLSVHTFELFCAVLKYMHIHMHICMYARMPRH